MEVKRGGTLRCNGQVRHYIKNSAAIKQEKNKRVCRFQLISASRSKVRDDMACLL